MIKHKFAALLAAGTVLSLGGGAIAQQNPTRGTQMQNMPAQHGQMRQNHSNAASLSPAEKNFLTKSAQGSQYEFAAAQLAVQKAQSRDIEQFALRLMRDHGTYNQALMQLARQKKIALPVDLDAQNRNKLARLQQLNGAAFDREYIKENTQANTEDVQELQHQASTAKDPQIKAFAAQFLPVQQQHSQIALAIKNGRPTASNATKQQKNVSAERTIKSTRSTASNATQSKR